LRPLQPMLAQTAEGVGDALAQLGKAAFEHKLDGARVQVHRDGDEVRIFTRELNDVTARAPEVVEVVRAALEEGVDGAVYFNSGTFESDDGQNFWACTHTGQGLAARKGRVMNGMGLGHEGKHPEMPGLIADNNYSEVSARGFYNFWAETMNAADWSAIRKNDSTWMEKAQQGERNIWETEAQPMPQPA